MKLKILGSSSAGNCYILDNGKEALIIECGVRFKDVQLALDFNLSRVVGCVVSHEHSDHAKYVNDFLDARINVWMSHGTMRKCMIKSDCIPLLLESGREVKMGDFVVIPFDVIHDAEEPYGFLINHPDTGSILFATDTCYLPYKFYGLNNILIECNYSEEILHKNVTSGRTSGFLKDRVIQSHMSYDTCVQALKENDLSKVNNIVLIHLSDANSNAEQFQKGVQEATGKTVHIADKGMVLSFGATPF